MNAVNTLPKVRLPPIVLRAVPILVPVKNSVSLESTVVLAPVKKSNNVPNMPFLSGLSLEPNNLSCKDPNNPDTFCIAVPINGRLFIDSKNLSSFFLDISVSLSFVTSSNSPV